MARYDTIPYHTTPYHPTGILYYAIDAKISVLIKINATYGPIGPIATAPDVVLEADVTNGTVRMAEGLTDFYIPCVD